MEELLRLTRETHEMVAEILGYVRKIQSPEYQEQNHAINFMFNLLANKLTEMQEQRQNCGTETPQQIFWR